MGLTTPLIDADAHVNPPATFWDDYLPASLKGRGPHIEEGGPDEPHDWIVFEGSPTSAATTPGVWYGTASDYDTHYRAKNDGYWDRVADIRRASKERWSTEGAPYGLITWPRVAT